MAKIEKYAAHGVWDPPTYSQAVKVTGGQTALYIAGQVAYGDSGNAAHAGDFKAQARAALQAVKAQVEAGGFFYGAADTIDTAAVALDARQEAALGPAPVAIHDDGDMPRSAFGGNAGERIGGGDGVGH